MSEKIHPQVKIGHVHLKVSDLERAIGFYRLLDIDTAIRSMTPLLKDGHASRKSIDDRIEAELDFILGDLECAVVSVRLPLLVGVGYERRARQEILITWRAPIPPDRRNVTEYLRNLSVFYFGQKVYGMPRIVKGG